MKNLDLPLKLQLAQTALLSLGCVLLVILIFRGTTHQSKEAAAAQQLAAMIQVNDAIRSSPRLVTDDWPALPGDSTKFSEAMTRSIGNVSKSIGMTRETEAAR